MRLKYPDQEYSESNPYVFATWDEFAEIDSIPATGNVVYFEGDTTGIYADKSKRVIDLNDTHPEGFENSIVYNGGGSKILRLNGNGWTIRNFVSLAQFAFQFLNLYDTNIIRNLNFLNCYHNTVENKLKPGVFIWQTWRYSNQNHGLQLINCKFSLLINAYDSDYGSVIRGKCTKELKTNLCSFNIKFFNKMTNTCRVFEDYMTNCNVKIKCFKNEDVIDSSIQNNCNFVNCKFYLDFKSTSSNSSLVWKFCQAEGNTSAFNNCYIDGKI